MSKLLECKAVLTYLEQEKPKAYGTPSYDKLCSDLRKVRKLFEELCEIFIKENCK